METMGGRGLFLGMAASSYTLGATVPAVLPNGLTAQIGPAIVSNGRGAVVGVAAVAQSGSRVYLPVIIR